MIYLNRRGVVGERAKRGLSTFQLSSSFKKIRNNRIEKSPPWFVLQNDTWEQNLSTTNCPIILSVPWKASFLGLSQQCFLVGDWCNHLTMNEWACSERVVSWSRHIEERMMPPCPENGLIFPGLESQKTTPTLYSDRHILYGFVGDFGAESWFFVWFVSPRHYYL